MLKWSPRLQPDAIELHRKVASQAGAVWWGRLAYGGVRAGLSSEWQQRLHKQLETEAGPTYVYLHSVRGGTWRSQLLGVTAQRAEVEAALIPTYYDATANYSLWVKLTDFHRSRPDELLGDYVLARTGEPVTQKGLNNQTPLIVRRRDTNGRA